MLPSTNRVPVVPGMDTESAWVVFHSSLDDPPTVIEGGLAVKESITGSGSESGALQVTPTVLEASDSVPAYATRRKFLLTAVFSVRV